MRDPRTSALVLLAVGALLFAVSCSEKRTPDPYAEDLQSQLIELQRAQASLQSKLDEVRNSILLLEEAVQQNKMDIARFGQSGSARITLTNVPEEKPAGPDGTPAASEPSSGDNGQGGELVGPPPEYDPEAKGAEPDFEAPPVDPPDAAASDAAFRKAWSSYQAGSYALAVYEWNEALRAASDDAARRAARYYLADSYFRLGEFGQAAGRFAALEGSAGRYGALSALRLGQCHEAAGRIADAKAQYEKVIAAHPGTDAAAQAQQRLADLVR